MLSAQQQQLRLENFDSRDELLSLALALNARSVKGWSEPEEALALAATPAGRETVRAALAEIEAGNDPLGERFCRLRNADERRPLGATYTPRNIVEAMARWPAQHEEIDTVIDPGAGSARFLVAAGRLLPNAELIGIELDPYAAILARGHLAAAGFSGRSKIILGDYRAIRLEETPGRKLFIGNPPYVRHHLIDSNWKQWLIDKSASVGVSASQLAGLHAYFFLATALNCHDGDIGIFVTSAEWLDVNYGKLVRELLVRKLGLHSLHLLDPEVIAFPGTATTAVITSFHVGAGARSVGVTRVTDLPNLDLLQSTKEIGIERFRTASRWTPIIRTLTERREGFVELGELCRVHRGQVTGSNKVWIEGTHSRDLPEGVLYRSVTKARDLFAAGENLVDGSCLRRVIDLPLDLDSLVGEDRVRVRRFLALAKSMGADTGYVARNRKAWWAVGLRDPAPILATYMARRPPIFVRNITEARHINIAHGLYPRIHLPEVALHNLAQYLSTSVSTASGRTYAGGLTKFEPKEMERLLVPHPSTLAEAGAMVIVH